MAQQKQSPLQVIQFLRLTYLLEPPLLWTALPSQCAVLCFPEHATTGTAESEENCSCETAVTFTTAMCYQQRKNLGSSLSKSQISNWMWFNVSNLFKSSESAGIWNGWIASPVASRSAERRDTSAMVFEDSLPKSDMPHSPEQAIRAWRCETKHWKEMPACCNMKPNMCLLQLCSFFVGDFGLQFIVWDQTLQQQWTSPVIYSHLLICLGHEHARKATGPVFWISLPSPCGAPWFPVKTWLKHEINPWLPHPHRSKHVQ